MSLEGVGPFIGEGFVGEGEHVAHINVVFGGREGPVGIAWTTALATPREGHVPFVAVAQPNKPIVPFTLFVNKAAITNDIHGTLTWGAAQAGIASGVALAHDAGIMPRHISEYLLIVAVWVNPLANLEELIYTNNREATFVALQMAHLGGPDLVRAREAMATPANPYFRQSSGHS